MSVQATHNDATDVASMQASLGEFLSGSAWEDLDESEPTESDEKTCEVAQREDTRNDVDYTQTVIVTENGSHYHVKLPCGVCACPHVHGEEVTLEEAIESENLPCKICEPVDYRRNEPTFQATVEGSL